ncbi:hypothetical protein V8C35DRAFT_180634 [Trichoderma chlorosporum]
MLERSPPPNLPPYWRWHCTVHVLALPWAMGARMHTNERLQHDALLASAPHEMRPERACSTARGGQSKAGHDMVMLPLATSILAFPATSQRRPGLFSTRQPLKAKTVHPPIHPTHGYGLPNARPYHPPSLRVRRGTELTPWHVRGDMYRSVLGPTASSRDTKMDWPGARLSIQIAVERDSMAVGQREKRGLGRTLGRGQAAETLTEPSGQ